MKVFSNSRLLALFLLLLTLASVGTLTLLWRESPTARIAILPVKPQVRRPLPQWTATPRMWLSRLKQALLGPSKSVVVRAFIIDFKDSHAISNLALSAAEFSHAGAQVWILPQDQIQELRRRATQAPRHDLLTAPGISTGDRRPAEVSITSSVLVEGTNQNVGVTLRLLPRTRRGSLDLTSTLIMTEAITDSPTGAQALGIRTNVALALRTQIPKDSGLFVLNTDHTATNRKSIGAIILPTVHEPRR